MNLSQKSQLINNITRFGLDSRIGKALLPVKGTSHRMGERISIKPGHSPVIMDFRHYQKGDPIKDIDWKLSARTERVFLKIREGYRQTNFTIAIDGSESMKTSYNNAPSKFITALTIAYIAGRVALKSNDRLYISWHGENIRIDNEYSLIDTLYDIEFEKRIDDFWQSSFESSANLFIISDFLVESKILTHFLKELSHITKNLFLLTIHDPYEENFNFQGRYRFLDPESEASLLAESRDISAKYHHLYNEHYKKVSGTGRSFGAKIGRVSTEEDPYHAFVKAVS